MAQDEKKERDGGGGAGELLKIYGVGAGVAKLAEVLAKQYQKSKRPPQFEYPKSGEPRMHTQDEADRLMRRRVVSKEAKKVARQRAKKGLSEQAARELLDDKLALKFEKLLGKQATRGMTRPLNNTIIKKIAGGALGNAGVLALLGYESLRTGKDVAGYLQGEMNKKKMDEEAKQRALFDLASRRDIADPLGTLQRQEAYFAGRK